MRRYLVLALLLAVPTVLPVGVPGGVPVAQAEELPSAKQILERIDKNMTFETRTMTVTMTSTNPRRSREFSMQIFARGEDQAAIEYTAPAREAGTRMLRKGDELWMYMPSVEKTQKISGHMLRQGMMGTDVSYEDMMTSSDLESAYSATVTGAEPCGEGRQCWKLELIANDPSTSYPKRTMWIDQEFNIALKQELYAVSGMLLKTWEMSEIESFDGGRYFPTLMIISDKLQEGTSTKMKLSDIKFGVDLEEEVFSNRWLERG